MHSFSYKYFIVFLSVIIYSSLLRSVKTEDLSEEKQLLQECLSFYNKTELKFEEIKEKIKNVRFNIILKIKYKDITKIHTNIENNISEITEKIDSKSYDKNSVIKNLKELKTAIETLDAKCDKAIQTYNNNEKVYNFLIDLIKIIIITLFIVIVIVLLIIGIISIIVIKHQRKYYKLQEEVNPEDEVEEVQRQSQEELKKKNDPYSSERVIVKDNNKKTKGKNKISSNGVEVEVKNDQ